MFSKSYRQKTGLTKARTVWQRFFPWRRCCPLVLAIVYVLTLQFATPATAHSQSSSPALSQMPTDMAGIRMATADDTSLSTDWLVRSEQESKRVYRLSLRSVGDEASEKAQGRRSRSVVPSSFVVPPLLFLRKILPRSVQDDPFLK